MQRITEFYKISTYYLKFSFQLIVCHTHTHSHSHTHPAKSGNGQGNAGLELIWILLAQTGDERDGCRHHALNPKHTRKRTELIDRSQLSVDTSCATGFINSKSISDSASNIKGLTFTSIIKRFNIITNMLANQPLSVFDLTIKCLIKTQLKMHTQTGTTRLHHNCIIRAMFLAVKAGLNCALTMCWSLSRCTTRDVHSPISTKSGEVL